MRQLRLKENDAAVARFVRGPETLFEEIGGQAVLCNTTLPPTGLRGSFTVTRARKQEESLAAFSWLPVSPSPDRNLR